jgi:hypothetical protein
LIDEEMVPISDTSDDSIPTSARALQEQKAARREAQTTQDKMFLQLTLGAVGVLALSSGLLGYCLNDLFRFLRSRSRSGNRYDSNSSSDDEGESDELLEDDLLAVRAAEFGRKGKRSVKNNDELGTEQVMKLLSSERFLAFLAERE